VTQPTNVTAAPGASATFRVVASGSSPLSYQWQRNGANIAGATATQYTIAAVTAADNGARFRCIVSNSAGSVTSVEGILTVTSNGPPTPTITAPVSGSLYSAGDAIAYSGTGTDPEDGTLPATAFTWTVVFHHATHTHPFLGPITGVRSGSFSIPRTGETSADVFYRIHLDVKDSQGQVRSTSVDILPRKATLSLLSSPSGLQLTLDGQPVFASYSFQAVVGMTRTIGVVSPQTSRRKPYTFASWSDGGAATHTITVPATNTSYTATFKRGR